MRKVLNTIWTRAENGQNPSQKTVSRYLWNPQKQFWASRNLALSGLGTPPPKASNSKTQARKPRTAKHAAKLSRNQPRTEKHKPESLEQQNTLWPWSSRCEKSQTPSGHEPKTAKTRVKKRFHVTFQIHTNNRLGLAKSGLGTALPKASNSKTQAQKPRTAKHAAKLSRNLAFEYRFRKPRTAKHKR